MYAAWLGNSVRPTPGNCGFNWRGVGEFAVRRAYCSEMDPAPRGATGPSYGVGRREPVKT